MPSIPKTKMILMPLILAAFLTLGASLSACGDPSAIDRAAAQKIVLETEANIEATRIAQEHKFALEQAEARQGQVPSGTNGVLLALVVLTVLTLGTLGLYLLVRLSPQTVTTQSPDAEQPQQPLLCPAFERVLLLDESRDADLYTEWASLMVRMMVAAQKDTASTNISQTTSKTTDIALTPFFCGICEQPRPKLYKTNDGSGGWCMACPECRNGYKS